MITNTLWLAAAGPLGVAATGTYAISASREVGLVSRAAIGAALFATVIAAIVAVAVAVSGPIWTPWIGVDGVGFGLYADRLSAAMLCLVSFIGTIVVTYSRNYMDGDPAHAKFIGMLCLTLAAVLTVILSGNLLQFTFAWVATSVALNRLLLFYPERPAAQLAARKKFLTSRLGDCCLMVAMLLLYQRSGGLDYPAIFASVAGAPAGLTPIAILLVCTALLKSAQFPLHGWLVEVMETPTPVSALLHAGIINAGGFLVLRFAAIIAQSPPALDTLAVLGGFTAVFGSVVMLTQTSIKVSLAYSTIAQMGFMMLECGLGAYSAALLHILAHSLYKAHAFLSSGSVIDIARASWTPSPGGKPHPARLFFAIVAVLTVTFAVSSLAGATLTEKPGVFALGAVLLLGLIHLVANGIDERPDRYVVGRVLWLSAVAAAAYFGLQFTFERLMASTLPATQAARGPFGVILVTLVVLSFASVTFLQGVVPRNARAPRWRAIHAHVSNGLYVNTFANRLILRLWPGTRPRSVIPAAPERVFG